jgi:DNA-binding transcriptional MerR regulator
MNQRLRVRASYLSLQAVARLSGVPPSRVRRYDAEGLIWSDSVIDAGGGRRLYATSVVRLVRRIHSYERIGVNLAGIEVILRLLEQRRGGRR